MVRFVLVAASVSAAPVALAALVLAACCAGSVRVAAPPASAQLADRTRSTSPGLRAGTLAALSTGGSWTDTDWQALLRVSVKERFGESTPPAVAGKYSIADGAIRFTPMFPFDEGRQYDVVLDAGRLPAVADTVPWRTQQLTAVVGTAGGRPRSPSTVVTHIYPSGDVSAGQSAPHVPAFLGADGLAERLRLRHAARRSRAGSRRRVPSARRGLLERRSHPLHGVLRSGSRQARHPAEPADGPGARGREAATRWSSNGSGGTGTGCRSRKSSDTSFRPARRSSGRSTMAAWKVTTAGGGDARAGGGDVSRLRWIMACCGEHSASRGAARVARSRARSRIEDSETRWLFTPRDAWLAGDYDFVAFAFLEDLAGNRVGRAFEVDNFERTDITSRTRAADPDLQDRYLICERLLSIAPLTANLASRAAPAAPTPSSTLSARNSSVLAVSSSRSRSHPPTAVGSGTPRPFAIASVERVV